MHPQKEIHALKKLTIIFFFSQFSLLSKSAVKQARKRFFLDLRIAHPRQWGS